MRRVLVGAAAVFLAASLGVLSAGRGKDPIPLVNPFIGTGGHGHTHPGASLPFGMVQLSPDTRLGGWDGSSGYHDSDRVIYGFSHTHLSGTGIPDYGDILLMPITGAVRLDGGEGGPPGSGYASAFDKSSEHAAPGHYEVTLADSGIVVDLTATERTGLHRYRFPARVPAHVVVDLTHRDALIDSSLRAVGIGELEGFRRSTGWAKDQIVYFVARFSRPFTSASIKGPKAALSFGDKGRELIVKVGISAVDIEGARRNLDAEVPGWDFDAVRRAARARWTDALSRITVEGGTAAQSRIFYTALYHSLIAPNIFSDVDGRYRGMDRRIHKAAGRIHYTVFSLWDTFRSEHPLLTLLEPARTRDFIETFLAQEREGGRLPVWELAGNETDTMIGYHAVPVIADAWAKGIRGFDPDLALEAMLRSARLDRAGLDTYKRQGFIGAEDAPESVSRTLEYGFDDFCIAEMAAAVGQGDVASEFRRRSQAWRHLLDPGTGFMRPRRGQRWLDPFDPRRVDNNYTEANAWQYSFFVPQDPQGLIQALGGDDRFMKRLDALFEADSATTGREQADITGLIGQYAHGNEPSHLVPWLYHAAGRPDRSAARVRAVLDSLYGPGPDGLAGNEDCGQMSAWYVLAAIGLHPLCPCTDQYALTPPLFDRVTLNLEGSRRFTVRTIGSGPFIAGAALNGVELPRSYLRHQEIVAGGELVLRLATIPGAAWGTQPSDRPGPPPPSPRVIPAPFVRAGAETFRDSASVSLGCADPKATIRYTLNPWQDVSPWNEFSAPFTLNDDARLRMVATRDGLTSPMVEATFHRIPNDWAVQVASPPNAQYTAGGADALVDGLRGGAEWRTGGWQGYQGADFQATVDLRRPRPIHKAGASFLQDSGSWIWLPRQVVLSVSADGAAFLEVARLTPDLSDREGKTVLREITTDLGGVTARYLRVTATSLGVIPDWHPGRGGQAFIFVDEILIQ